MPIFIMFLPIHYSLIILRFDVLNYELLNNKQTNQTNSVTWVNERTIPTERPPLVGEVITNFCG
jgi:hypothetical protein